jgi:hypothetical protein
MICGSCHSIDPQNRIAADGGWILSKQQYDEWQHSVHNAASQHYEFLTCVTCHYQHASSYYQQGGLKDYPTCDACHPDREIAGKESLECIDCHMPYSVRSSKIFGDNQADMRSHLFRVWVTTAPRDSMFYTDSTGTFVKLDSTGMSYGNTLDLVCLRCHPAWTIEFVYPLAENIHEEGLGIIPDRGEAAVKEFALIRNFPNPFNAGTTITFSLPRSGFVSLSIVDLSGRVVDVLVEGNLVAGNHEVHFNPGSLASGLYFCRLSMPAATLFHKILLIK